MPSIEIRKDLISKCGLYCGSCRAFLKQKCKGCSENLKASWCKVRSCCLQHEYSSCADCAEFTDPANCSMFNNFISRAIGFFLNSDRRAGIMMIKEQGADAFARHMSDNKRVAIKKRG